VWASAPAEAGVLGAQVVAEVGQAAGAHAEDGDGAEFTGAAVVLHRPPLDAAQLRRGVDQAVRVVVEVADADVAGAAGDSSDFAGAVVVVDHRLAVPAGAARAAAAGARRCGKEGDELLDVEP
jgi:hypothetical protein